MVSSERNQMKNCRAHGGIKNSVSFKIKIFTCYTLGYYSSWKYLSGMSEDLVMQNLFFLGERDS